MPGSLNSWRALPRILLSACPLATQFRDLIEPMDPAATCAGDILPVSAGGRGLSGSDALVARRGANRSGSGATTPCFPRGTSDWSLAHMTLLLAWDPRACQ